jgi:hypothetical protein
MTDDYDASIKQKALTTANALLGIDRITLGQLSHQELMLALVHVVEQSEAFGQEVSDAIKDACKFAKEGPDRLTEYMALRFAFLITPKPKPDPLVKAMEKMGWYIAPNGPTDAENFRAALDALGFEIREKGQ